MRLARGADGHSAGEARGYRRNLLHIKVIDIEQQSVALAPYLVDVVLSGIRSEQRGSDKTQYRGGRLAEAVDELIRDIVRVRARGYVRNAAVNAESLRYALDICRRDVRVYGKVDEAFLLGLLRQVSALLAYRLLEHLKIHLVAYGLHVSVLLRAEYVARSAQLKVAHGYLEARAELRKFSYRVEPARGYFRQLPAGSEREICARPA